MMKLPLSEIIRKLRREKHMTQSDITEALGIIKQYLDGKATNAPPTLLACPVRRRS